MKSEIAWRGHKFSFDTKIRQHHFVMDISKVQGGDDLGPTPKELVVAALCGCAGMDVVGLLRKSRVEIESLEISAEADTTTEHPKVFKSVRMLFAAKGPEAARVALIDAVSKSESLYCGVGAMVAKTATISFRITLNDALVFEGEADFPN